MGMGASQDLAIEHAGQLHVEGVGCPAGHLCDSVHIVNMRIDELNGRMDYYVYLSWSLLPVIAFCHRLDGPHDAVVACAAADISFDALFDLFFGGGRIFLQEGLRRHQHARGTETALVGTVVEECLLDGCQFSVHLEPFRCT